MTIYDLILRLQEEVGKGNGDKLFCVEGSCFCPAVIAIEPCKTTDDKLMIKFRNEGIK